MFPVMSYLNWIFGYTQHQHQHPQHPFVTDNILEKRTELFEELKQKHPEKIPIILSTKDININKDKYVVSYDITTKQLIDCILNGASNNDIIFVLVNDILVTADEIIKDIYDKHKSEDGFLYLKICKESLH